MSVVKLMINHNATVRSCPFLTTNRTDKVLQITKLLDKIFVKIPASWRDEEAGSNVHTCGNCLYTEMLK